MGRQKRRSGESGTNQSPGDTLKARSRLCWKAGNSEPPRAPCHSHTLAPGQKGSGRGRPTDWVRAAASREGSVDSWKLLLEGFALGLRDCRSAAQDARPGLTL